MNRLMSSLTTSAMCAAMLAGTGTEALAQPAPNYQPPPQGYDQPPPQGYAPPPQGYQQGYQQGYSPQQRPYADPALQPPPGYSAEDAQRDASGAAAAYCWS